MVAVGSTADGAFQSLARENADRRRRDRSNALILRCRHLAAANGRANIPRFRRRCWCRSRLDIGQRIGQITLRVSHCAKNEAASQSRQKMNEARSAR